MTTTPVQPKARIPDRDTDPAALGVRCPYCDALPGTRCTRRGGDPLRQTRRGGWEYICVPHTSRSRVAAQLAADPPERLYGLPVARVVSGSVGREEGLVLLVISCPHCGQEHAKGISEDGAIAFCPFISGMAGMYLVKPWSPEARP